jgi:hypothetical protein
MKRANFGPIRNSLLQQDFTGDLALLRSASQADAFAQGALRLMHSCACVSSACDPRRP